MIKRTFTMCVHEDEYGYWCEFPELRGCFTDGNNMEELIHNAKEAIKFHIEYMKHRNLIKDEIEIDNIESGCIVMQITVQIDQ